MEDYSFLSSAVVVSWFSGNSVEEERGGGYTGLAPLGAFDRVGREGGGGATFLGS